MTSPKVSLAQLRGERDAALAEAIGASSGVRGRLTALKCDAVTYTGKHPGAALGGALAVGTVAGVLLAGDPLRRLARSAVRIAFWPLASDVGDRLLRFASGSADDEPAL